MAQYTANTIVEVYPFTRQPEDDDIIIGNPDTAVFLVLPPDAVELLDRLAEGKTVGEARSLYQDRHGEVPDMQELLEYLELKGFVQPENGTKAADKTNYQLKSAKPVPIKYHFANFPQSWARKIFSRSVLGVCGAVIGLALVAAIIAPDIIPGWSAHFFDRNFTLMNLLLISIGFFTVFLHEMAHLIAARAVGVSCRLGLSHRLWVLVAETDMTGVWGVPRNQRYLPFLAGPLLDAVSASVLVLFLFAVSRGWLAIHPFGLVLSRAILLSYLLSLLSQCYFFVRTDFYYVFGNFLRCKSLMKDTEIFLRNQLARILRSSRQVDQSYLPRSEKRVIRWYAILWLAGRIAAFSALFLITIPLTWHYGVRIFTVLSAGYHANPYAFIDSLSMIFLIYLPQSVGFWLWIRSFSKIYR